MKKYNVFSFLLLRMTNDVMTSSHYGHFYHSLIISHFFKEPYAHIQNIQYKCLNFPIHKLIFKSFLIYSH